MDQSSSPSRRAKRRHSHRAASSSPTPAAAASASQDNTMPTAAVVPTLGTSASSSAAPASSATMPEPEQEPGHASLSLPSSPRSPKRRRRHRPHPQSPSASSPTPDSESAAHESSSFFDADLADAQQRVADWKSLIASITAQVGIFALAATDVVGDEGRSNFDDTHSTTTTPPKSGATETVPTTYHVLNIVAEPRSRVHHYLNRVVEYIDSQAGRATIVPDLPIPHEFRPAPTSVPSAASAASRPTTTTLGQLMDIAGYDFAADAGTEAVKSDLLAAVASHVESKSITYHHNGHAIVAHPWIHLAAASSSTSPASTRPLVIEASHKHNYYVDAFARPAMHAPRAALIQDPINPLTAAPELVTFPIPSPASASASSVPITITSQQDHALAQPSIPASIPCTHEPVLFDRLLTGAAAPRHHPICLECFPALACREFSDAATALSDERWQELLVAAAKLEPENLGEASVNALIHMRDTAHDYVSDAWPHAVQQAGSTLGAESPTSAVFTARVADAMMARVAGNGEPSTAEDLAENARAAVVGYALKDVARAMLDDIEAFRAGAPRDVVDAAVDLTMTAEFRASVKAQAGHGQMRPWDLLVRALNNVWTETYSSKELGFQSLVSEEEREWAKQQEADAVQESESGAGHGQSEELSSATVSNKSDDGFEEGVGAMGGAGHAGEGLAASADEEI